MGDSVKFRCPHDGGTCHHACANRIGPTDCDRKRHNMSLTSPWPGFPVDGIAPVWEWPCPVRSYRNHTCALPAGHDGLHSTDALHPNRGAMWGHDPLELSVADEQIMAAGRQRYIPRGAKLPEQVTYCDEESGG